jgi:nitronate monooxygenase
VPVAVVRDQIDATLRFTNRSINVNFFAHPRPSPDAAAAARARTRLQRYYEELDLGPVPEPAEPFPQFDRDRLELLLELRPRVVSFHFGR